jgi:hypothetical protein
MPAAFLALLTNIGGSPSSRAALPNPVRGKSNGSIPRASRVVVGNPRRSLQVSGGMELSGHDATSDLLSDLAR